MKLWNLSFIVLLLFFLVFVFLLVGMFCLFVCCCCCWCYCCMYVFCVKLFGQPLLCYSILARIVFLVKHTCCCSYCMYMATLLFIFLCLDFYFYWNWPLYFISSAATCSCACGTLGTVCSNFFLIFALPSFKFMIGGVQGVCSSGRWEESLTRGIITAIFF